MCMHDHAASLPRPAHHSADCRGTGIKGTSALCALVPLTEAHEWQPPSATVTEDALRRAAVPAYLRAGLDGNAPAHGVVQGCDEGIPHNWGPARHVSATAMHSPAPVRCSLQRLPRPLNMQRRKVGRPKVVSGYPRIDGAAALLPVPHCTGTSERHGTCMLGLSTGAWAVALLHTCSGRGARP